MEGVRTAKRRVLRLMREHGLLAPSRAGLPRGPRNHDGTIIPDTSDTMWGTDLTTVLEWPRAKSPCSELTRAALTVTLQSSPSTTARPSASAFMRRNVPPALRRSSRSAKVSGATSAASRTTSPAASPSATTTAVSTWRTTSKRSSASSASRAPRPSSHQPRAVQSLAATRHRSAARSVK